MVCDVSHNNLLFLNSVEKTMNVSSLVCLAQLHTLEVKLNIYIFTCAHKYEYVRLQIHIKIILFVGSNINYINLFL